MTLTVRARVETWEAKSRRAQKESNSRAGVKPMDNDITLRAIKKLTMGEREVENLSGGSFQLDERRVATHRTKLTSAAPTSLSKRERAARREKGSCVPASGHRAFSPLAASARFPKTRRIPSITRRLARNSGKVLPVERLTDKNRRTGIRAGIRKETRGDEQVQVSVRLMDVHIRTYRFRGTSATLSDDWRQ